jgi:hypothetical protein
VRHLHEHDEPTQDRREELMPSIIFDYEDIASRMKGDLKPCKKPTAEPDSEPAAKIGFLKTKVKKKPAPIVSDDDDDDDDI